MGASEFYSPRQAGRDAERNRAGKRPASAADRAASRAVSAASRAGTPAPGRLSMLLSRLAAFARSPGGGVAIESALSISLLLIVFGGLIAIVHAAYTDDRMGRAARAAARAVALDPSAAESALTAVACDAIRNELDLAGDFDCTGEWTLSVTTGVPPSSLAGGGNGGGQGGDMVLVELGWEQAPWSRAMRFMEGAGADAAIGVACSEPALQAAAEA